MPVNSILSRDQKSITASRSVRHVAITMLAPGRTPGVPDEGRRPWSCAVVDGIEGDGIEGDRRDSRVHHRAQRTRGTYFATRDCNRVNLYRDMAKNGLEAMRALGSRRGLLAVEQGQAGGERRPRAMNEDARCQHR